MSLACETNPTDSVPWSATCQRGAQTSAEPAFAQIAKNKGRLGCNIIAPRSQCATRTFPHLLQEDFKAALLDNFEKIKVPHIPN